MIPITSSDTETLEIGPAIRRLRLRAGRTLEQLADAIGSNKGSLSKVESGKQGYSGDMIEKLAAALGLRAIDIFIEADVNRDGNAEDAPQLRTYRSVPVVGTVEGGPDGYLDELGHPVGHGEGTVEHPSKGRNTYALRVRGESMHPRIRSGEFIVAEPDSPYSAGDDVVVVCFDGRKMVKQFLYQRNDEITLGSINNGFKPLSVPLSEIQAIHYVAAILPHGAFTRA